jgi:hypothetical protein
MNLNKTSQWAGRLASGCVLSTLVVLSMFQANIFRSLRLPNLIGAILGILAVSASVVCLVAALFDYLKNRKKPN